VVKFSGPTELASLELSGENLCDLNSSDGKQFGSLGSWGDRAHRWAPILLRVGLGVVYTWFGVLKLFPGLSPAEGLVLRTTSFVDPHWFYPVLAFWEVGLGLCFLSGRGLRWMLPLFFGHMLGTALPLLTVPEEVWVRFPFVLTLEGQYIVKNLVLVAAGVAIAANEWKGREAGASR